MGTFSNRVAIVTGGANGIGRACARALAAEGAAVMIADAKLDGASAVAAELSARGSRALAQALDVSDPAAAEAMVKAAIAAFGRIDVLVHSAGIGAEIGFLDTTPEQWRRMIDVDLSGTFYVCQAAARRMVERRYGRIVLLSSVAGLRGGTGRAAYGAAKGGVVTLAKVMAVELAPFGVTVNTIAPGPIETDMVAKMHDAETRRAYGAGIPADRYGTPEEVATAALFLASEAASYVNGHTLAVDGGFTAAGVIKRPDPLKA